jgi:hypothetical protein
VLHIYSTRLSLSTPFCHLLVNMPTSSITEEDIVLPPLPKQHDYATDSKCSPIEKDDHDGLLRHRVENDGGSLSDTATNSEDEFDWNEDEEAKTGVPEAGAKAKRGRRLYLLFIKLARPVRVLIVGLLGSGIFIAPFLIVQFRFKKSPVTPHVRAWSLWFAVIWAASSLTYLVVDLVPRMFVGILRMAGMSIERLRTQVEVRGRYYAWPHRANSPLALDGCIRLGQTGVGHCVGLDRAYRHPLCLEPTWLVLGYH